MCFIQFPRLLVNSYFSILLFGWWSVALLQNSPLQHTENNLYFSTMDHVNLLNEAVSFLTSYQTLRYSRKSHPILFL
jgi:hypothetical protein